MNYAVLVISALVVASPASAGPDAIRRTELEHMVRQDCGSCHGMTLKGGLGPALLPERLGKLGDEAIAATILDGRPGTPMPPWRGLLSENDVQWIVQYLRGRAND